MVRVAGEMLRLYMGSEESLVWDSDGVIYSIGRSVMDRVCACVCVRPCAFMYVCMHVFTCEYKVVEESAIVLFATGIIGVQ